MRWSQGKSVKQTTVASVSFMPLSLRRWARGDGGIDILESPLLRPFLRTLGGELSELAMRVRRLGPVEEGAILMVAGCRPGAGCSTVALALAAGAATSDQAVMLIDANMGHPDLSHRLGGPLRPCGWEALARGESSLPNPVPHLRNQRILSFLPYQQAGGGSNDLPVQAVRGPWLTDLRRQYDLIVLDSGAVEQAVAWGWAADVSILVCESGKSESEGWAAAWDRLESAGPHLMGIVETATANRVGVCS